jgi:hypothetical protein
VDARLGVGTPKSQEGWGRPLGGGLSLPAMPLKQPKVLLVEDTAQGLAGTRSLWSGSSASLGHGASTGGDSGTTELSPGEDCVARAGL